MTLNRNLLGRTSVLLSKRVSLRMHLFVSNLGDKGSEPFMRKSFEREGCLLSFKFRPNGRSIIA